MANSTIAQLNVCNPLTGAELVYADDGTNDVKVSTTIFRNYIYNQAITINATSHGVLFGNSAGNLVANASILQIANSISIANVTPGSFTVGTFSANTLLVNAAALNITGQINAVTLFVTTSANISTAVINSIGVNAASHTVGATFIANTLGVYTTGIMNAAVQSTTGFLANATHVVPASNSSGQNLGNTISRWVITANSLTLSGTVTLAGQSANSLGFYPTSNTVGNLLGNTISRFDILASTIGATGVTTLAGQVANSLGIYPNSNTVGNIFGNTISRPVIVANSVTTTGNITAPNTGLVTSTTAAVNGATYLTGGILLQWGWVASNNAAGNITFPIAFPTNIFSYNAIANSAASNAAYIIAANTTTMNVRTSLAVAATNTWWMAIGN